MRGFGSATASAGMGSTQGSGTPPAAASKSSGSWTANPITWVIVMAVLLATAMFFAHKVGKPDEFSNVRASFYNIFAVTFTVIVGVLMLKVIFSKFNVPGLSDAILAV